MDGEPSFSHWRARWQICDYETDGGVAANRLSLVLQHAGSSASAAVAAKIELQQLPIRAYLDQTVVPVLLQGMSQLVKERWDRPTAARRICHCANPEQVSKTKRDALAYATVAGLRIRLNILRTIC